MNRNTRFFLIRDIFVVGFEPWTRILRVWPTTHSTLLLFPFRRKIANRSVVDSIHPSDETIIINKSYSSSSLREPGKRIEMGFFLHGVKKAPFVTLTYASFLIQRSPWINRLLFLYCPWKSLGLNWQGSFHKATFFYEWKKRFFSLSSEIKERFVTMTQKWNEIPILLFHSSSQIQGRPNPKKCIIFFGGVFKKTSFSALINVNHFGWRRKQKKKPTS